METPRGGSVVNFVQSEFAAITLTLAFLRCFCRFICVRN